MREKDVLEMHRLIDEGVRRAQKRLWHRAGMAQQSLVVYRDGKVVEMVPETDAPVSDALCGDPLARRKH